MVKGWTFVWNTRNWERIALLKESVGWEINKM